MIDKTHKDWPHAGPALARWLDPGGLLMILEILQWHLAAHLHDAKLVRKLSRTIAMVSKEAWHQAQHNLNAQIREFVLPCPKRRAFVRSVIGEAAIKRWETRYKNRFALPLDEDKKPKGKARKAPKPYKWKPYALPEIGKIFKGQSFALPGFPEFARPAATSRTPPRGARLPANNILAPRASLQLPTCPRNTQARTGRAGP